MYSVMCYRCTIQCLTIFKGYTQVTFELIVIVKYWLSSLCFMICPCSLLKKKVFVWLHQVLVAACRIFVVTCEFLVATYGI